MKKSFLIMSIAILLSGSGNCQWLNRHYGVNDFNQLSQEQLNEALIKAQNGVAGGIILSILGAIGLGVGGYLMVESSDENKPGNMLALPGIALLAVSIPMEIGGLVKLSRNSHRVKSIKEVLKGTEWKIGLVNYQRGNIYSGTQGSLLPCLSVRIRF
jgi:hypothetical protein